MMSHDQVYQSLTSEGDVAKVHNHGNNLPNVPHFSLCEVEHFHGTTDDGKVLLVSHVPPIMLFDDVTGHCVALVTHNNT